MILERKRKFSGELNNNLVVNNKYNRVLVLELLI